MTLFIKRSTSVAVGKTVTGTFLVGGAVRDQLLGRTVSDRDWVVVGRTPEAMLADGFTQVGKDFPVFLHPVSHEEYALARTERKTALGHHGFECHAGIDVTLEEDLQRRDLTVNALARGPDGVLIDPYGGERDLRDGVLRHVSPAFAEDPLRILRVARFAAQLGFVVAPETIALMRAMAGAGALAELPAERVWQEFHKALDSADAAAFLRVLQDANALQPWFVELYAPEADWVLHGKTALQRFGSLGLATQTQALARLAERLKAPKRFERFGFAASKVAKALVNWRSITAAELLAALQLSGALQGDALERREDFLALLAMLTDACGEFEAGALARLAGSVSLLSAAAAIQAADDAGAKIPSGPELGLAIAQVREAYIQRAQQLGYPSLQGADSDLPS